MDSKDLKNFACDILQNTGRLLNLPQVALATAQMLLHKVYSSQEYSIRDHPIDITAMAALFLAAKVEEHPRKAHEVIDVITYVISEKFNQNPKISLHYTDHDKIKFELFDTEKRILKNSGFDLLSKYPHKMLVTYYKALVTRLDPENNIWTHAKSRSIIQTAWNYCNDSLRTDIFNRKSSEVIVCACLELSFRRNKLLFPKSTGGKPWYSLFVDDKNEVEEVMDDIDKLYGSCQINLKLVEPYLRLGKYIKRYR